MPLNISAGGCSELIFQVTLAQDLRFLPPKQHLSAHAVSNLLPSLAVIVTALQKSSHLLERLCSIGTTSVGGGFFVMMMTTFWAIEK